MSISRVCVTVAAVAAVANASIAAAPAIAGVRPVEEHAVYASVLNKQGVPVATLEAADFVVREDGVEREVIRVAPADEPLRIAVLVDTSQSMERAIPDTRRALQRFLDEMQGHADIAVFEYGDRSTRLVDYTRDLTRLQAAVGRLFARPASGSRVLDAIVDASRDFRRIESARPVIVVISGQGPEFSQRLHQNVLDELRTSHATLHSLVLTRRRAPILDDAARERELTLSEGATLTGGRREHLLTSMALSDRLTDLARELKAQYRVVYARPDAVIQPDRLRLAVRQPRLVVRAPRIPRH